MTPELLSSYARMLALLFLTVREYRDDPCDILGGIYRELNLNNEWNGQYFTPDDVCRFMAQITLPSDELSVKDVRLPLTSRPAARERWLSVPFGRCSIRTLTICGKPIVDGDDYHAHHIRKNLPLSEINRVSNLASTHRSCHKLVHGQKSKDGFSPKAVRQAEKYRKKLLS